MDNLSILLRQLSQIGITDVFINGAFVEDKDHLNDIDGCFVCELRLLASGDLQRQLNLLDPHKIWTWEPAARRAYRGYPKKQLPMWHQYRVELYPHVDQLTSIRNAHGHEISQRQLAERLGMHESQISRDERNEYHSITLERAARVLDALRVELHSTVQVQNEDLAVAL